MKSYQVIPTVQEIKKSLAHHLHPTDDPCTDRGISWPCDVAEALMSVQDIEERFSQVKGFEIEHREWKRQQEEL